MDIDNPRVYGLPPYRIAVIHGGPGAGGEMAPVARELASVGGVLEPIQTAVSLEGQVQELRGALEHQGTPPITLIGYSWGAWLAFILTARYPALVRQLILVSSGPFEEAYVAGMHETRMSRLNDAERIEFERLLAELADPAAQANDAQLARLGALAAQADSFEPLPDPQHDRDAVGPQAEAFQGVWTTAAKMRSSGELLRLGRQISCPVIAIHGDHDPHPAEGVAKPLSDMLPDFRLVLLERCGHKPWVERHARDPFYRAVRACLTHRGSRRPASRLPDQQGDL